MQFKRLLCTGIIVVACVTVMGPVSGLAGVTGNSFSGSFVNSDNETATSCMRFDPAGVLYFDQDFGTGPVGFADPFFELDFGLLSIWISPSDTNSASGISLLSLVTTLSITSESDPTFFANGFYVISTCQPVPPALPRNSAVGPIRGVSP